MYYLFCKNDHMFLRSLFSLFFAAFAVIVAAQQPRLVLPIGHTDYINDACFSPDGKYVLTASNDGTIKLWMVQTGMLLMDYKTKLSERLTPHAIDTCKGMCGTFALKGFSPDGNKFITFSGLGTEIWSVKNDRVLFQLQDADKYQITNISFSANGKHIVGKLSDSSVRAWSAADGLLLPGKDWEFNGVEKNDRQTVIQTSPEIKIIDYHKIMLPAESFNNPREFSLPDSVIATHAFYNPDKRMILVECENNYADNIPFFAGFLVIDLASRKFLPFLLPAGDQVYFSPDPKKILIVSNQCTHGECGFPECSIWDIRTGENISTIKGRIPYLRTFPAFSPDSKMIVTINDIDSTIRLWNIEHASLLPLGYSKTAMNNVPFSKDSRKIMLVSTDSLSLKIAAVKNGELLKEIKQQKDLEVLAKRYYYQMGFTDADTIDNDWRKMLSGDEDGQQKDWKESVKEIYGGLRVGDQIRYATWSPDENRILTSSYFPGAISFNNGSGYIQLWDSKTGKLLKEFKDDDSFANILSEQSDFFIDELAAIKENTIVLTNARTGKKIPKIKGTPLAISADGKLLVAEEENGSVNIVSVADGILRYHLNTKNENGKNDVVTYIAKFSPDGKRLVTISGENSFKLWNMASGKLISKIVDHPAIENVFTAFDVFFNPAGKEMMSVSDSVTIWSAVDGKLITKLPVPLFNNWQPSYSPDGKKIIAVSADNSMNIWDAFKHTLLYSFFQVDSVDYLYMLPSGYYKATGSAARRLHYVTKDLTVMTFEQLDVKYNRPDKVLQATGCKDTALIDSYRKAYYKRIKKLGIDSTAFSDNYSIPMADIVNRDSIGAEQKTSRISLHIKATDSIFKLDRFNCWINEVPLFGMKGISIRNQGLHKFDTTITVDLSEGNNRIETSVTNMNGIESYRKPLLLKNIAENTEPGKVYFIGIGINRFADSSHNLKWCEQDIKDLTHAMKLKYGDRLVIVDTLYNEKATRTNIRNLKQKLMHTDINDKVIISYSGHGLLSKEYDYYLSSYTVNFSDPEEGGIPYDEIENMLDSIPARKKILLLDACNSGEVDKEEMQNVRSAAPGLTVNNTTASTRGVIVTSLADQSARLGLQNSFDLMQSLFVNVGKGTGAIIIAAAGGVQFAQERSELGHGVFTYSVMEAMKKYPAIKVSEFKKYIGNRVMQLTNGLQKPTTRNETIAVDWEVW